MSQRGSSAVHIICISSLSVLRVLDCRDEKAIWKRKMQDTDYYVL
jgi:hypothetical protein